MKLRVIYILPLMIHLLLTGCISMPESKIEIEQGIAESRELKNITPKEIKIEPPKSESEKLSNNTTLEELYKLLKFNPKGESLKRVALKDPIGAIHARDVKDETVALTQKLFPNTEHYDNKADAFRHAYFSLRLSQEIGSTRAKRFTDAYEISNINKIGSRCMDLWNNREGRKMCDTTKHLTKLDKKMLAKRETLKAIETKQLALKPFGIKTKNEKTETQEEQESQKK